MPIHTEAYEKLEGNLKYGFISLEGNHLAHFFRRRTEIIMYPIPLPTQFLTFYMPKYHAYKKIIDHK